MSDNTFEENNIFRDYKSENFDDGDLQSRLYAKIYYEFNIEDESKSSDNITSRTIQFDSIAELNPESESIQKSGDKQPSESEIAKGKSNKAKKISREHCNQNAQLPNVSSIIDFLMSDNTLEAQDLVDSPSSIEIHTNTDKLSSREMNHIIHEHGTNNDNSGNSLAEGRKKQGSKEITAKKNKSSSRHRNTKPSAKRKHESSLNDDTLSSNETKHSKYNVLSKSVKQEMSLAKQFKKDKEDFDSSDSEESIFEVPVPPKPTPLLINLQDSDEENDTNSEMDNQVEDNSEKVTPITSHEITGASSSHQNTSPKNKNTDKSLHNKNTTVKPKSTEIREDIVLNCTIVQKGAKSIDEIKQLAKSAELNKNQRSNISIEDNTSKDSAQQLSQNIFKENTNLQQETFATPGCSNTRTKQTRYNLRSGDNKIDEEASCTINRKRQYHNKIESNLKRQCIVQPNNQSVMQQSNSSEQEQRNEPFQSASNVLRKFYYDSSRGQENFDVSELQQGMSRDPRMWKILDVDLMPCPPSKQRNRFFNIRCNNCQRDGHQRYDCPIPRRTPCCYMCGERGHVEFHCPQKICLTCGKQQNTFRKTCEYCRVLYCTMCHSVGHESLHCPDLWRRYHQTTNTTGLPQNPDNAMKPPSSLYCCNCTKRGHESTMCKEYRWSQHFPTPAAVTNYTNGPMYPMNFSDDVYEQEIQSFSEMSNSRDIQQSEKEFSINIDTSPSSTRIDLEVEGNLESSTINTTLQPVAKLKKLKEMNRPNKDNEIKFTHVIYSYGKFYNKDHENGWIITRDFSMLKDDLTVHGKRTVMHSLIKYKVQPTFLKILSDKGIEFEVKIGHVSKTKNLAIVLQVIAMKEYIELIYNLLLHWINIPDNEKEYGLDVTLPMNPTKMFNLFTGRIPQFAKMSFVSYAENIKNVQSDPRWLFNSIKQMKVKLEHQAKSKKAYLSLRRTLWRIQLKLLMIVNTEPMPNAIVSEFYEAIKRLEFEKQNQTIEKLDPTTYLQFTLLFNHLFVPHTPAGLYKMLWRFKRHAEQLSNSLPQTQEMEQNKIDEPENLAAIEIQQLTSNETLIDNSDAVNKNEMIVIEDTVAQNSKDIVPLNTEALNYIEPVSISVENVTESEQSCDDIDYNTIVNELDINAMDMRYLTEKEKEKLTSKNSYTSSLQAIDTSNLSKKQKRKMRQQLGIKNLQQNTPSLKVLKKKKDIYLSGQSIMTKLYHDASNLVKQARNLELPHFMNAANELQKRIKDKTIEQKHINAMKKMIRSGRRYQMKVNTFWEHLQT